MTTATVHRGQGGILRHSPWDAVLVALAVGHGVLLVAAPSAALVGVGLWWNANTVAHNFIHRPFFRRRGLNVLFSLYLSAVLGIPQTLWRERHLAHHAGVAWRLKINRHLVGEALLVVIIWGMLAAFEGRFFVATYLPGYALGLGLCWLHGFYEHNRGTVSHYGRLY